MAENDNIKWMGVYGHPNYLVSSDGRIRSKASGVWVNKKPYKQKNGYIVTTLGRKRRVGIHIIVLEAFVCQRPKGMECRHLDGNPANNNLDNLKWGTSKENHADQKAHGTRVKGERHAKAKITDIQRLNIKERYKNGERQSVLASEFGLKQPTISYIVNHGE